MAKIDLTADDIQLDLDGLSDAEVSRCILKVVNSYLGVLQKKYSSGQKPDGSEQKLVGKNTLNADGDPHPLQGQPSQLVDTGALRKSMISTRRGEKRGARIVLAGTHPSGKLNAQIAAELNRRGFENTYIGSKDLDTIVKDVVDCLMQSKLRNLVSIKK